MVGNGIPQNFADVARLYLFPAKQQRQSTMKHNPATLPVDKAADGVNIHAFLQQAVDHYPQLVAFSFNLLLPHSETLAGNRVLIMRFHTEVWQRIGEYSWQRQQARRHSPPTILRWLWEPVRAAECKMVLLMNSDTLDVARERPAGDSVHQDIDTIISHAWRVVTQADGDVINVTSFFISRTDNAAFTMSFNQLRASVQEMMLPVMMARTGVVRP